MRYFKAKKIIADGTTHEFVYEPAPQTEKLKVMYAEINGGTYWGVDDEDVAGVLARQYPECLVEELTFEQISPILENCALMKTINKERIEDEIAKVYSVPAEIGMLKKADDLPEKIAYNNFVANVKAEANIMKVKFGLRK